MSFVKLDTGILDSTLWIDRPAREIFITALLMAEPYEVTEPQPQFFVNDLQQTGFTVPLGWYGFIRSAGIGIINRARVPVKIGTEALERLGSPELSSRSADFEGRRLVRIDGGYIVLNYFKYRDKDHTNAERQQRFRARKRRNGVIVTPVTQADADADADAEKEKNNTTGDGLFNLEEPNASLVIDPFITKATENQTVRESLQEVWDDFVKQFHTSAYKMTSSRARAGVEIVNVALASKNADADKAVDLLFFSMDRMGASDWHRKHHAFDWEKNFCRNIDRWMTEARQNGDGKR